MQFTGDIVSIILVKASRKEKHYKKITVWQKIRVFFGMLLAKNYKDMFEFVKITYKILMFVI